MYLPEKIELSSLSYFIKKIDKKTIKHKRIMARINVVYSSLDFFNLRIPCNTPRVIYSVFS